MRSLDWRYGVLALIAIFAVALAILHGRLDLFTLMAGLYVLFAGWWLLVRLRRR